MPESFENGMLNNKSGNNALKSFRKSRLRRCSVMVANATASKVRRFANGPEAGFRTDSMKATQRGACRQREPLAAIALRIACAESGRALLHPSRYPNETLCCHCCTQAMSPMRPCHAIISMLQAGVFLQCHQTCAHLPGLLRAVADEGVGIRGVDD